MWTMHSTSALLRSTLGPNAIGFERLAQLIDATTRQAESVGGFPAYDLEKVGEDSYRLTLAVAGFARDEIAVETAGGELTITGKKADPKENGASLIHRGIAQRSFRRKFHLDDHVEAAGASLENGLLVVELKRELPEADKPRRIAIK
jgi:molecular chaperone IbpA